MWDFVPRKVLIFGNLKFVELPPLPGRRNLEHGPRPEAHLLQRALPPWTEDGFRSGAAMEPLGS